MTNTFTPVDLIAFMYRELPAEVAQRLQRDLAIDAILREQFVELDVARRTLPRATFAPADESLKRILAYSSRSLMKV